MAEKIDITNTEIYDKMSCQSPAREAKPTMKDRQISQVPDL